MNSHDCIDPSLRPSSSGTLTLPASTARSSIFEARNSKVAQKIQNHSHGALFETMKRATIAEREAGKYLKENQKSKRRVEILDAQAKNPVAAYKHLTAQNETLKESVANLQKRTKACEEATNKAQEDAQNAKCQLRCVEKRCDNAERELKVWKERYGNVEYPAEQMNAIQMVLLDWQTKVGTNQGHVAGLEGERRCEETQTRVKLEEDSSGCTKCEQGDQSTVKTEEDSNSGTSEAGRIALAEAEAKATKYKVERDALHRMLQEEVAKNSKMTEALVLRNAKIAESLEGEVGR